MQRRKFFTPLKPMLIHRTFIVGQKMTGHFIHDHQPVAPFFQVTVIKFLSCLLQVAGEVISLIIGDQYHQAFTAVSAVGTTDGG